MHAFIHSLSFFLFFFIGFLFHFIVCACVCDNGIVLTVGEVEQSISPYDLKRLESYSFNLVDYHMILDLVPSLARFYFLRRFPALTSPKQQDSANLQLSFSQSAILLAIGLQHKTLEVLESELGIALNQILALFNKTIRKFVVHLQSMMEAHQRKLLSAGAAASSSSSSSSSKARLGAPVAVSLNRELNEGGKQVAAEMKKKQQLLLDSVALEEYAIKTNQTDFEAAIKGKEAISGTISVKSQETAAQRNEKKLKMADYRESKQAQAQGGAGSNKKRHKP